MTGSVTICDARKTSALLPLPKLMDAVAQAARDLAAGTIRAPARQAVPFPNGAVMLSMPATAPDLGMHKLVTVAPQNRGLGLPTIHGTVSVCDGATGRPRLVLDGPTVTSRRTAAVSMLGLRLLHPSAPERVVVIGTGTQATGHVEALASLFPGIAMEVVGHSYAKAQAFASARATDGIGIRPAENVRADADVILTLTTSMTPVYDQPPDAGRVVVGVGAYRHDMAEIGPRALVGARLYVDDATGARGEAGDFLQAGVDWNRVEDLAGLLRGPTPKGPSVFKVVGCSAWDLAAARCALDALPRFQG